ncbi:MAG TPA: ABC transporter substrate-binding protein [Stellaceae bacterium]|nr:ABC transporter substrate-binding protein [Stellaceae bacterium]
MRKFQALMLIAAGLVAGSAARAEETLEIGGVGGANAVVWAHYIAEAKGLYAAQGLKIDLNYSQSNAQVLQALTAGSTKMAIAAGIADPMYAFASGAGIAIVRIDGQVGPYALEASKQFKTIKDLKGHIVSVDEAKGTTMVYFNKMLAANGMKRSDVDFVYAGATAARFAALESGAAAASMITAPQLFTAEAHGFVNLGTVPQYAPDTPFTVELVNRAWAQANKATAKKYLVAYSGAIKWFDDEKNKAEAVDILGKVTKMSPDDIAKSYDFLKKINYFERSDTVSLKKLENYYNAQRELDPSFKLDVPKLVMKID